MKKIGIILLAILMAIVFITGAAAEGNIPDGPMGDFPGFPDGGAPDFNGPPPGFMMQSVEITGPYEIVETEVECESHGLTLRGKMTVPVLTDKNAKIPMAVLTHGFTSSYNDMNEMAEGLGKHGIASVRFNLTGTETSDGEYVNTTLGTQKEDILNVLAWVKTLDFVDTDNLFLCGKSQGSFCSAWAALDCEDEINALILWYPALCIPDDYRAGNVMGKTWDPENIPEQVNIMGPYTLSRKMIEEGCAIHPNEDFIGFKKPVLIIHGDADNIVPYHYAEELAALYGDAEYHLISGAGHGFNGDDLLSALDWTVAFIQRALK